jgi:hypothetical protein
VAFGEQHQELLGGLNGVRLAMIGDESDIHEGKDTGMEAMVKCPADKSARIYDGLVERDVLRLHRIG